jgi:hypothetical protein
MGTNNTASGDSGIAFGLENINTGNYAFSVGENNKVGALIEEIVEEKNDATITKGFLYVHENKRIVADNYDSTSTYYIGDYVIYENKLYECKVNIIEPEEWNPGHWELQQTYYLYYKDNDSFTDLYMFNDAPNLGDVISSAQSSTLGARNFNLAT